MKETHGLYKQIIRLMYYDWLITSCKEFEVREKTCRLTQRIMQMIIKEEWKIDDLLRSC